MKIFIMLALSLFFFSLVIFPPLAVVVAAAAFYGFGSYWFESLWRD